MTKAYVIPTVREIKASLAKNGPRFEVVSLFAGGGGSSTGYRMAGGKALAVNEFVPAARESYAANWPDTIIFPDDVRQLTGAAILERIGKHPGELDILDGSPPCSAFSTLGSRDKGWGKVKKYSDTKQESVETLFFEFVRILSEIRPRVFVAENVAALAQGSARGFLNEFFRAFEAAGYVVRAKVLDAKYLGVPQSRRRLIFVGVRKDLWRDSFEGKTHPAPFAYTVPLRAALVGVRNTQEDLAEADCSRYAIHRELVGLTVGGQSEKYFSLVKADPRTYSPCLTATAGNIGAASVCHWENRKFTIPELKRIASVPDDYALTGTYQQRAERLGRMVPPLMMRAVADTIYENILKELKNGST